MGDTFSFSFFFLSIFIYMAALALGLCCCVLAFSSCGEQGLLLAVASLVAEHGLSSCEASAELPCSTWNLPD